MTVRINPTPLSKRATSTAFIWTLIILMVLNLLSGCISENDLTAEQRSYKLYRELMCPVCDGQTLDQSNSPIAEDMKQVVITQISNGRTNQEIRDYFILRYGNSVLAAPTTSGFNLIAWIIPFFIVATGIVILSLVLRNMRENKSIDHEKVSLQVQNKDLSQYLDRIDEEIQYIEEDLDKKDDRL